MSLGFRDLAEKVKVSEWLRREVGARLHYGFTVLADALGDATFVGVRARFPSVDQPDALPYLGRDRDIDRGPYEPAASFVERVKRSFDTHSTQGHPREMLSNLLALLLPNVPVVRAISDLSVWDTISGGVWSKFYAPTPNWNWDGRTKFGRGWVVIFTPSFKPSGTWGVGKWDTPGRTWDSTATPAQIQAIRNNVRKEKPANMVIENIIVAFDPAKFDPAQPAGGGINPDGSFGRPYKSVGGVARPTRFADAAYWDGAI